MTWQPDLNAIVARAAQRGSDVLVITGAGVSAESGIPTFRGPEGYWTVGSAVYQPEELATRAAFTRMPADIWRWYLHRRAVCQRAVPNAGHDALATLERTLGDRFCLLSQNVDGLHLRAGNSRARTYEIHGNIDFMRCARDCSPALTRIPVEHYDKEQLVCPRCAGPSRPHVLWFDEYYDETLFRFESSLRRAETAALVVTVGTSGATNLPNLAVETAARAGACFIDINPEDNPFRAHAAHTGGLVIPQAATVALPLLTAAVANHA